MKLLFIVLGFLVPVIVVFGYSRWLFRRRRTSDVVESVDDPERKIFSALGERCTALKNSVIADNATNVEEEIDSVLVIARSFQDENLKDLSLSQVMGIYVAAGRDKEARALLSEVKGKVNRACILKDVFGNVT